MLRPVARLDAPCADARRATALGDTTVVYSRSSITILRGGRLAAVRALPGIASAAVVAFAALPTQRFVLAGLDSGVLVCFDDAGRQRLSQQLAASPLLAIQLVPRGSGEDVVVLAHHAVLLIEGFGLSQTLRSLAARDASLDGGAITNVKRWEYASVEASSSMCCFGARCHAP